MSGSSNPQSIENIRHSLAHLLAAAVLEKFPDAKLAIGPTIDNGFYYDFLLSRSLTPDDLKEFEKSMRRLINKNLPFSGRKVSAAEAKKLFAEQPFKLELIEEFSKEDKELTVYQTGDVFMDLCRGGHVENTSEITADAFKLDKIAGAYWRGSEKNPMLQRIYGLGFSSKKDLEAYLIQREEALKRDHRKIAREQDLLVFSDLIGSGMPMYTPKGNIMRNAIIAYSRELNNRLGFGEVHTPNINKAELFKLSGHYDAYKEDMLTVRSQYVSDEMFLKPMNCPQHTQIYASQARSYRELPIRYSDFANLYRDERPGELSGLTRLRSFAQDDGHIFCRDDQIEGEVSAVLDAIQEILKTYHIDYWMRLSLRGSENDGKYLGDPKIWQHAEKIMASLLKEKRIEFKEAMGEAAFYGPKIDIMAVDAIGRQWQISTVQLDFVQPSRFGLEYIAEDGSKKTPVMIHRALVGSPDRFLGILIEHYAGDFPTWLAPIQAVVIPISDKFNDYGKEVHEKLVAAGIRSELDDSNESLNKRIRASELMKIRYSLVVGEKEVAEKTVAVRDRKDSKQETVSIDQFISKVLEDIKQRAA